jgi:gamma-glutamyltranspeptidase
MVDGFMLNNQLTDFSFSARDADGPVANRVEMTSGRAADVTRSCSTARAT